MPELEVRCDACDAWVQAETPPGGGTVTCGCGAHYAITITQIRRSRAERPSEV